VVCNVENFAHFDRGREEKAERRHSERNQVGIGSRVNTVKGRSEIGAARWKRRSKGGEEVVGGNEPSLQSVAFGTWLQ
jgi:hypothetical protein